MMILAVAPRPIGPPILKIFSKMEENPLIISGKIPQNHNTAVKLDITNIKGNIANAKIKDDP
jgi:hypothetical protein